MFSYKSSNPLLSSAKQEGCSLSSGVKTVSEKGSTGLMVDIQEEILPTSWWSAVPPQILYASQDGGTGVKGPSH